MKTIISREPGFRRCGVAHPAEKTYPDDAFTDDEWARLDADPMLTVVKTTDPASSTADEDAAAAIAVKTESGGEVVPGVPADLVGDDAARVAAIGEAIGALPKSKVKAGVPDMVALEGKLGWRPVDADVAAAVEARKA